MDLPGVWIDAHPIGSFQQIIDQRAVLIGIFTVHIVAIDRSVGADHGLGLGDDGWWAVGLWKKNQLVSEWISRRVMKCQVNGLCVFSTIQFGVSACGEELNVRNSLIADSVPIPKFDIAARKIKDAQ